MLIRNTAGFVLKILVGPNIRGLLRPDEVAIVSDAEVNAGPRMRLEFDVMLEHGFLEVLAPGELGVLH